VFILQRLGGATLLHSHSIPHEGNLGSAGLYFVMNGKINAYYFSNEMVGQLLNTFYAEFVGMWERRDKILAYASNIFQTVTRNLRLETKQKKMSKIFMIKS
jgi:hypothetical protein